MKIKVIEREDEDCPIALFVLVVSLVCGFPSLLIGASYSFVALIAIGMFSLGVGFVASFFVNSSIKYVEKEIEVPENALGLNEHTRIVVFDGKEEREVFLNEALLVKIESNPYGE